MSKHSKTCAYNNQAKGIKEFVPVAPPLVDEAKARGWEGSVWRFVGDEDTEAKLNGIADLAGDSQVSFLAFSGQAHVKSSPVPLLFLCSCT